MSCRLKNQDPSMIQEPVLLFYSYQSPVIDVSRNVFYSAHLTVGFAVNVLMLKN
jgi:hypothetical protein